MELDFWSFHSEPSFQQVTHKPDLYPLMNVQIKGYDFPVLESYQSYIHNLVENMGLDVTER